MKTIVKVPKTMPEMTGFDLAGRVHQVRPDIPIVLCTGFSSPEIEDMAAAHGIRLIVKKPVGPRQLAEIVNQILFSPGNKENADGRRIDH